MLAIISTFPVMAITKYKYYENESSIVHQKCHK
jgi:hypothetical protein